MIPEGNGGFLLKPIRPSEVTADDEKEGYEIGFAFEKNPSLVYCSEGSTTTINMTFSPARQITGVALINHNLHESASILLRFYDTGGFSTPIVEKNIPWHRKNIYINIKDNPAYQYVQIQITVPSGNIQIGVIFPGTSFQFPYNFAWGYEEEFCVTKEVDTTDYGVHFETPDPYDEAESAETVGEYEKFKIDFDNIPSEHYSSFFDLIRPGKKVFIPSFSKPGCHYGIVPDKNLAASKYRGIDKYSIRFWEDAIGETQ